jgi:hypothetical protein
VREEIEVLEHHAHFAAHLVDALEVGSQFRPVDDDLTFLVLLKPIDAADERRLARAGGASNDDAFAFHHREVDVAQHVEVGIPLVHADDFDGHVGRRHLHVGGINGPIDGSFGNLRHWNYLL